MFYKINKALFSFILLLVVIYSCKRDDIVPTTDATTILLAQAKQFVKEQAPQSDFQKIDWQRAIVYKKKPKITIIRIPLFGNTKATQKAVYLTFNKGNFSGNYFELHDNKITTLSLDNSRKCIANVTDNKQIDRYAVYESGQLVSEKILAMRANITRPPQFFVFNYNLYCMIELLGLGQGGENTGHGSSQGNDVVSYLQAIPDGSQIGNNSGGGGTPGITITIDYSYLSSELAPTDEQYQWLLSNPMEAAQVYLYLQDSLQPEKTIIAKEHLQAIIADINYMNFVLGHTVTGNPTKVWWEDAIWLDNPTNFSLDYDDQYDEYKQLKAAEKYLLGLFPLQGYIISKNVQPSFEMSEQQMGVGTNRGVSDKKDAFRHAFFNAINTRDVPPRLIPVMISAASIVKLFADAHETETLPQLKLEAQMDKFNNQVGIDYCWNCYPSLSINASIAGAIKAKLNAGELLYLSPLDPVNYPYYNKDNPTCTNCTNGIVPGVTILTPSNQ